MRVFHDRREAGRELARRFVAHRPAGDLLVLALPRGGVPVARELATALGAPLDVFLVRKLGAPFNPEFAIGAIGAGGVRVLNDEAIALLGLGERDIATIVAREERELARRERLYRAGKPPLDLAGKTAILVDDGIATGATMRAAVAATKSLGAAQVIVASPTASREAVAALERSADFVVALAVPEPYGAVGQWYEDFRQVEDQEVLELLEA